MKITEYIDRCIFERFQNEIRSARKAFVRAATDQYEATHPQHNGGTPEWHKGWEDVAQKAGHRVDDVTLAYHYARLEQLRAWVRSLPDMPPEWAMEPTRTEAPPNGPLPPKQPVRYGPLYPYVVPEHMRLK